MLWIARASTTWAKRAALEVVQRELYDVIMCHSGYHTGPVLSQKVTIIKIHILRVCLQVLRALNGTKRSPESQDMQLDPRSS